MNPVLYNRVLNGREDWFESAHSATHFAATGLLIELGMAVNKGSARQLFLAIRRVNGLTSDGRYRDNVIITEDGSETRDMVKGISIAPRTLP